MSPVHLTPGAGRPRPLPGWTFLEGGGGCWRIGPLRVVYLTMVDPHGRVWLEWFSSSAWIPLGVRVLLPHDHRFDGRPS